MKEYIILAYMETREGSSAMGMVDRELIRCKDCEFYNPEKMCVAFSWIRGSKIKIRKDEEDFCSWAMKKKK